MNKKWTKYLIALTFIIVALPAAGWAQDSTREYRSINARQHEQQQRIREGIRSGELTRREARRLEAQEARVRVDEAYARRSGGQFTPRERARIQRELNHTSRDIYRQKHDRQIR